MRAAVRLGLAAMMLATVPHAGAQTSDGAAAPVWRCGNAYSHQPCESGQAIPARDGRTAEQREQAERQQQRLKALLDARDQERAAAEARQARMAVAAQRAKERERTLQARQARRADKPTLTPHQKRRLQASQERKVRVPRPAPSSP